jgi:hypothetical protein
MCIVSEPNKYDDIKSYFLMPIRLSIFFMSSKGEPVKLFAFYTIEIPKFQNPGYLGMEGNHPVHLRALGEVTCVLVFPKKHVLYLLETKAHSNLLRTQFLACCSQLWRPGHSLQLRVLCRQIAVGLLFSSRPLPGPIILVTPGFCQFFLSSGLLFLPFHSCGPSTIRFLFFLPHRQECFIVIVIFAGGFYFSFSTLGWNPRPSAC